MRFNLFFAVLAGVVPNMPPPPPGDDWLVLAVNPPGRGRPEAGKLPTRCRRRQQFSEIWPESIYFESFWAEWPDPGRGSGKWVTGFKQ